MSPIRPANPPSDRHVRRVGTQSTVDHVDREIRRAFVEGVLRPGEEFSMADLSAQLEVSHVPVREALRRLEAQGLVILRPGRSAVVAPLHVADVEDVYRLWILICTDVIARACPRYGEQELAAMQTAFDTFTALPQDSEQAFDAHYEFHRLLLLPGASAWDLRLLDILWLVIERAVRIAYRSLIELAGADDPRAQAHEEHRVLLEAAQARDVARLQAELRAHHERHMRHVVAVLSRTAP